MREIKHTLRVLPVHFVNPTIDEEKALAIGEELESLIATLGGKIVDRIIERHFKPNNATYIGKVSLTQAMRKVKHERVDVVVLNAMLKPRQLHEIRQILEEANPSIEVWDRIDLILQIFDKHATTTEAKLQIKLARMRYMGPSIYGMGHVLSQQGGGIGTSGGAGETNTELMKRHWRNEMKTITGQLDKIEKSRRLQLERRKKSGFKTASIVGYTNAGKSSLFNALTGKNMLVEGVLFATLDNSIGKIYISQLQSEILITDTIGFIRNLPPRLLSAFTSTLMESMHADLLLHVIDMSDPEVDTKIDVVNDILRELGRDTDDIIYVFNKNDIASRDKKEYLLEKYARYSPLFISVKAGEGIGDIKDRLTSRLTTNVH